LEYRKEKASSIYGSKLKLYLVTVLELSCMCHMSVTDNWTLG
jgi:hypothetical protein